MQKTNILTSQFESSATLYQSEMAAEKKAKRIYWESYTVFVFWCKRGLVCRCLKPFTPNRKYGAEFPERSENRFRKSVDFRKTTDFGEIRVSEKVLFPGL